MSKGGEELSLYPDDARGSCLACCLPTERRRLHDVAYKLREHPKFRDTIVLDLSQEPDNTTSHAFDTAQCLVQERLYTNT